MSFLQRIQNSIYIICFVLIAGALGYYAGVKGYEIKANGSIKQVTILNKNDQLPDSVDFARFWDVWNKLSSTHIKKPINPNDMLDGAIQGMVASIGDPYSVYLTAKENKEATSALNGKYEGIGAHLGYNEQKKIVILASLENSPAEKSGLRSNDIVLAIDGKDTNGWAIDEAVAKIRGTAGTDVTLSIYRAGTEKPFDVKLTRQTISVASVKWEDKGNQIAYIKLSRFGEDTNNDWTKNVKEMVSKIKTPKAVILDVRNNPGGYLDSSIYIASEFIDAQEVVKESFSDGKVLDYKAERKGLLTDKNIKIIVLINEGSASASEIVAGALKEKREATLVGMRSFGKGTVQKSEEYKDGAALHITIAKWLTPNGNWIDKHNSNFNDSIYNEKNGDKEIKGGIKPDVRIEVKDEDIKNQKDPQLEKAIEIANNK